MLEPLHLEKNEHNPEVILNKDENIFRFAGRTLLEDAIKFYAPIQNWFHQYVENPNPVTEVEFKLDYINSASIKKIVKILHDLEEITEKGNTAKVLWYYRKGDEVMKERGEEIKNVSKIPVELIEFEIK